jgi:hypothetical protein
VNWQNLKSNLGAPARKLNERINSVVGYLSHPLNLFRFVAVLLVVDFVAFMSLTKSSYLQLLNPAAVLWAPPTESRSSLELYFPRSLSLTGLEKMYPEDEKAPTEIVPGATGPAGVEIPLAEADIAKEVILIPKYVAKSDYRDMEGKKISGPEATARRVVHELIDGPGGNVASLKARNILKNPLFIRSIWLYDNTVYISTEKNIWDKMGPNERKISEYCIRESLKKNLGSAKFVLLKE